MCIAGAFAGSVALHFMHEERAIAFYTTALREAAAPLPADTSFDSLRLAYARTVAQRAPFMALPETDPPALRNAAGALAHVRDTLVELQQTPAEKADIEKSLYPIPFLYALADAEEARQKFVKETNILSLEKYQQTVRVAFEAYQKNLSDFRDAFVRRVPSDTGQYVTTQKSISTDGVLAAIDVLTKGIEENRRSFERMEACLSGFVYRCNIAQLALPAVSAPESADRQASVSFVQRIVGIFKESQIVDSASEEVLVETAHSACADLASPAPYVFTTYESKKNPHTVVVNVSDLRLVPSKAHAQEPFFDYFVRNGAQYVYMNPFTYYNCAEFGSDLAEVFETLAVRDFVLAHSLHGYAPANDADTVLALEKNLASYNVSQSDALKYLSIARSLLAQQKIPDPLASGVTDLILSAQFGSAYLDRSVTTVAVDEAGSIRAKKEGVSVDLSAPYLFFVRSGFLLFYLSQNASAVAPQGEFFSPNTLLSSQQPYVFFSQLSYSEELKRQLVHDLNLYHQLYQGDI